MFLLKKKSTVDKSQQYKQVKYDSVKLIVYFAAIRALTLYVNGEK